MIYFDADGLPVDRTGDGGDSAVRSGLLETFAGRDFPAYSNQKGLLVRHPTQQPWSNPQNFSRDQLIVKMTGLWARQQKVLAEQVFWSHFARLFFCQNSERDFPGSKKYPWPHRMNVGDKKDLGRWRLFDYRDILMPDQIWHLIKCAEIQWLSLFAILGAPWLVLSIFLHSISGHKEHNQIICQCYVAGKWAVRLFRKLVPDWKEDLHRYWQKRDEVEYADLIIRSIDQI